MPMMKRMMKMMSDYDNDVDDDDDDYNAEDEDNDDTGCYKLRDRATAGRR